ncbi:hypothetical protein BV394_14665 [Brevirhabdus pacifica]|uniref:Uncharacterized protein n=2 Tax=Brevirhabdus pacifica TaxID=1267768 RepID=A0A1U7DLE0_9RHOB|nr:hypothetical protein BV394_14665 [Brevirhabdus pacifica]OWU79582.1 hypothetical protein ATO5_00365 [Loktanella sp. 22II-4b]PJJ87315.1 hypothetical protein CLV77_1883 [Brevirhabdus pacifica]
MTMARAFARHFVALVLCLGLVTWLVMPSASHAPKVVEALSLQAEILAEHGHVHDLDRDVVWALHGHGHDGADHDHSPAMMAAPPRAHRPFRSHRAEWRLRPGPKGPTMAFLIERPPRA